MKTWHIILAIILLGYLITNFQERVSGDYATGMEYNYFADGTCRQERGVQCIDGKQAEYLCGKITGFTKGFEDSLKMSYIEKNREMFQSGNMSALSAKWNGRRCIGEISADGTYHGTSTKVTVSGAISTFVVNPEHKSLAHYIDETVSN